MSKNKTMQKLTAMMLSIIMVAGMTPVSKAAETSGFLIGASGEITAFAELKAEIAMQSVSLGTSEADLELPDSLTATVRLAALEEEPVLGSGETDSESDSIDAVSGVEIIIPPPITWASSPTYDGDTEGEYRFVPELPEGLILADGAELPTITVMVSEGEAPVFAARGMSTSLPNGTEYPETVEGLGTEEDPLRIETAAQLAALAWSVNHGSLPDSLPEYPYLILVKDLDLSDYDENEDEYRKGWVPIGGYYNEDTETYAFSGTFDGNHKTIRNLYVEREERYVGLFGYVAEGTVKNLTVENGNVTGYSATGGIVGNLYNGQIENCVFSGSVTGEESTGGIVGELDASQAEDCKNTGRITGKAVTGGIVGGAGSDSENDYLRNCINTGTVTGADAYTGGIVGLLVGMTADYCVNTGTVQGGTDLNTGGVAGTISEGIIQNCVNGGPVSGSANNIGGLAGLVRASTIQNCVSYADVSGTANSVGGVAGFAEEGSAVTNCLTTGNISGEVNILESGGVSGVVGRLQKGSGDANTITSCVALGQTVIKDGEMGNVARITSMDDIWGNTVSDNFAWSGMRLFWDEELVTEDEYYQPQDGENADAATLQTLWTAGALAESWGDAGVWTLRAGKLPVLTGLPHQSDKFPSHIPMATVDPASKTFTAATAGYKQQAAQQFTIENTGTAAISGLSAALTDGTSFEISTALSGTEIPSGSAATISIRPKTGLSAGTYSDILSITSGNGIPLTVSLSFTVNSSPGDGSGSGGSYTPPVTTTTPEKKPDQPVTALAHVTAMAGTSGTASVTIPDKAVTAAIDKAQSDAKTTGKTANGIAVGLSITMPQGATSLTATLTRSSLNSLVNAGVVNLEISDSPVNIRFDLSALKAILAQSSGDVTISITPVHQLSASAQAMVGARPVYDITFSYAEDGKIVTLSELGDGIVTISIPYAPGKNEAAGFLYGVYVDAKGNATRIGGSAYDADAGAILISTGHLSVFGIGYTPPSAKFTDISSHWAKESIDYVLGRGLFSGVSDAAFAPDTTMTRGMFVTALGRLANADVSSYKQSSFTDVKAGFYYVPYIEWAYKKGIIQGIGNNQFAPDRAITREEIAVIFADYAKAASYKLPVICNAITFSDSASISHWAKTAVTAMQQAGIVMGGQNNKFNPKASATRAEVSSMLHRYIKLTIDPSTAQGWVLNDNGQWLYYKDGKALTDWQSIYGVAYSFTSTGVLQTGWVKDNAGNWHLYSGNKALVGWQDISRGDSKKTYYFAEDGIMASGKWLQIDAKWYYFNADGSLARNTKVDGYDVDENGIRKEK